MFSSTSSGLFNHVPRAFHDLIARVVPGFTIIACICVVAFGPDQTLSAGTRFLADSGVSFGAISALAVLVLVASYVLAMLLEGLGEAISLKHMLDRFVPWKGDYLLERTVVALHFPQVSDRLDKIRAERGFCENLMTGWLLLAVACPFVHYLGSPSRGWSFPGTEFALTPLLVAAFFLRRAKRRSLVYRLDFWYKRAIRVKDGSNDACDSEREQTGEGASPLADDS